MLPINANIGAFIRHSICAFLTPTEPFLYYNNELMLVPTGYCLE